MPHYLLQVAYTPEAWATMTKNPQDRAAMIRPAIEGLGGRLVDFYFAFGEYDAIAVVDMPGNVESAGFAISVASKGAVKAFKTTPLLTPDEAMAAMRTAAKVGYEPPA
jgi:uncharacterized protein with GYD domain